MKKKCLVGLVVCLLVLGTVGFVSATTLTFDTAVTPGVTLGGNMRWNGVGGGHLYNEGYLGDDSIVFDFGGSIYLNDFQMNAMPWENYGSGSIGSINIAAMDSVGGTIWNTTADLTDYTAWSDWLTISVETANVAQLYFTAPGSAPHYNGFWPSVDNVRFNEDTPPPVPEPSTILLMGAGLLGLAGYNRKRSKK